MTPPRDLTGARFGRLVAARLGEKTSSGKRRWVCRCDCGGEISPTQSNLVTGTTTSCGCFSSEQSRARHTTHGETRRTAEYRCWRNMINRCTNERVPEFARYGARGISVCERWRSSYESFLIDIGRKPSSLHSIDRIDNDGNYEPGNCRWATAKQQRANRRDSKG